MRSERNTIWVTSSKGIRLFPLFPEPTVEPDFVIDDYPEIVAAFSGVWVPPYFFKRTVDQEMDRIYRIVCDVVESGSSEDRQYKAKGSIIPLF